MHTRDMNQTRGMVPQAALLIGAFGAIASFASFFVLPLASTPQADIRIEPSVDRVTIGDTFVTHVVVSAQVPANVFAGEIQFDHTILQVDSISYNTSIADIWAEEPWYKNGEGTIGFAGGSTMRGGFQDTGTILSVTFRAIGAGVTAVQLKDGLVLAHDGLGSEVALDKPIDAVFAVDQSEIAADTLASPKQRATILAVSPEAPSTDLNNDGTQSLADVSIFMIQMLGYDARFDFNQDGQVSIADLSILMNAR